MPYVIVTYDVAEKRVARARKILKKYLTWVQNSVYEGDITDGKLRQCEYELSKIINAEHDSVYFYRLENRLNYRKKVLGIEKETAANVL
jgi:CRISPR-associated protein Cas2